MKVICIENRKNTLPTEADKIIGFDSLFAIVVGKIYIVYGMTVYVNMVWYYIADEDYSFYPIWTPASLFDVVDDKISRYWVYSFKEGEFNNKAPLWTFPDWAQDPDFYDRLLDFETKEVAIFKRYKELMDLEFEDPRITEYAQKEEDGWLICWSCYEAWQSFNTLDALVKCPKCEKILNNPRYVKSEYSLAKPF